MEDVRLTKEDCTINQREEGPGTTGKEMKKPEQATESFIEDEEGIRSLH
jgi:hypothetical protein